MRERKHRGCRLAARPLYGCHRGGVDCQFPVLEVKRIVELLDYNQLEHREEIKQLIT